jgi:hypothetical protein
LFLGIIISQNTVPDLIALSADDEYIGLLLKIIEYIAPSVAFATGWQIPSLPPGHFPLRATKRYLVRCRLQQTRC